MAENNNIQNKSKTNIKKSIKTSTKRIIKKKKCMFCENKIQNIDYKNVEQLKKYLVPSGKITQRLYNGNCNKHQKIVSNAIKKARIIGLLPYINR